MDRRFPLVIWSLMAYLAMMLVGLLFKPILGLWPFLFLLATQELLASPDGEREMIVAIVLGIVPIFFVAWFRQRHLDDTEFETFDYAWNGFWTTIFALGGVTAAAFLVAKLLGWRIGV